MDMKRLERNTSARLQNDEAEALSRLAAGLSRLQAAPGAPEGETDLSHALRTRRRLRRPLSSAL
ncbi:hypothetical protein HNE_0067 [Hyphomonas neptunium ATCC 15444]|uniref:Uncharacterized protein n=2 Tax=Hyphomonas TaxID=85 RepID=Q0C642_HYPNA|nr:MULTISPECIES: hypothetical protein [Hyphomonas]ABI76814.1 hypothetical protein HNE_0067 [Hyphomonas neptunium ATCC 15444]KCZ94881.1 hypothetical protein HHI_08803 [Hyphomonas hirschiana VP5]